MPSDRPHTIYIADCSSDVCSPDLTLSSLTVTPAANSTTDFSLSVTATASDADGESTTSAAQSIAVTVSPDAPVLSVTATAAGAEDTASSQEHTSELQSPT